MQISNLSDGQQSRIVFAMICLKKPNLLLLDEPVSELNEGQGGQGWGFEGRQRQPGLLSFLA